jgi:hypothetical protein
MASTTLIIHNHLVRITKAHRRAICEMGLCYAVVIKEDVSVRVKGAVESVHRMSGDAFKEAERLSGVYKAPGSFVAVDLNHIDPSAIPLRKE